MHVRVKRGIAVSVVDDSSVRFGIHSIHFPAILGAVTCTTQAAVLPPRAHAVSSHCAHAECCGVNAQPAPTTETEVFLCMFDYIDRLFANVRPRKLLFMAIGALRCSAGCAAANMSTCKTCART